MITNFQIKVYDRISSRWYHVASFSFPLDFNQFEDIASTAAVVLGFDMSEFEVRKGRQPYYRRYYV